MSLVYLSNDATTGIDATNALPSGFTQTGGSWSVNSSTTWLGHSKQLSANSAANNQLAVLTGAGTRADQELFFTIPYNAATTGSELLEPLVRMDAAGTSTAYMFILLFDAGSPAPSATSAHLWVFKRSGGDSLVNNSSVINFPANSTAISCRVQAVGTTIRGKFWATQTAEPTAWTYSFTDAAIASGYCGFNTNIQAGGFSPGAADIIVNAITTNQVMVNQPAAVTTSTSFTVTGVYEGTAPTAMDYAFDATAPGTWTAFTSFSASGGTWTGTATSPSAAGLHTLIVRDHNTTTVQNASPAFTVNAPASITVTTPSTLTQSASYSLSGSYTGTAPTNVQYAYDGGSSYTALTGFSASGGAWSGTATAPSATGSHTVTVQETNNTAITATSGSFTVTVSSTIQVTTPGTLAQSASYTLSGTYGGTAPTGVQYAYDGGSSYTVLTGFTASGGTWSGTGTAPSTAGSHTVTVQETNNTAITSTSGSFTVSASNAITVNTPGTVTAGSSFSISGSYTGTAPTGLNYSFNGGTSYSTASGFSASGGSWSAIATAPGSAGSYQVTVQEANATGVTATSGNFTVATGTITIDPSNAAIIYSPYTWNVTAGAAQTINPGAYFRVLFSGNTVGLTFNVANLSSPQSQIWARVDFGPWTQYTVASSISLTIPAATLGNTDFPYHLLEVMVKSTSETLNRWNSPYNTAVILTGIVLASGATVLQGLRAPRNVLIYGDSITEGVRTVGESATNDTDRNDAMTSYAYHLGRVLLGAEVGVVGFGAQGINNSGSGNVPGMVSAWNQLYSGASRSFTPQPDMIIINQGGNDGNNDTHVSMTTILNGLLAACPNAAIVVTTPMRSSGQPAFLQQAIAACNNPQRIRYLDTITNPFYNPALGSDTLNFHPNGPNSVAFVAPKFAAAVKDWFPSRGATHY